MMQASEPPAVVEVAPVQAVADFVVLARSDDSEIVTSSDQPLLLRKGARTEDALLRRVVFVTRALTVTRPADAPDGQPTYRWSYASFLQRQLCLTSMVGDFACTSAEVVPLVETAVGEAPLPAGASLDQPSTLAMADAVRSSLTARLRANAASVFEADRRTKVDPSFKAAGVVATPR